MDLVNSTWLAPHLNDENVRFLVVRIDVMHYFPGPMQSAVHLSDFSLRAPNHGVPAHDQDPESSGRLFTRAGVSDDHHVVVYSQGEGVTGERMGHV